MPHCLTDGKSGKFNPDSGEDYRRFPLSIGFQQGIDAREPVTRMFAIFLSVLLPSALLWPLILPPLLPALWNLVKARSFQDFTIRISLSWVRRKCLPLLLNLGFFPRGLFFRISVEPAELEHQWLNPGIWATLTGQAS
jgi:hypothetical protein